MKAELILVLPSLSNGVSITRFSTRPYFHCGNFQIIGFGGGVSIARKFVLSKKMLKIFGKSFSIRHCCSGRTGEKQRSYTAIENEFILILITSRMVVVVN